jgi:type IX secretion system PorP/SprF family membrane protein
MTTYLRGIVLLCFLGFSLIHFSQQIPQSNLYNYNRFSLNPAYAGITGCTELNFSHLNQWIRVSGAPRTSFISINAPIRKRWGIGGSVLVDRLGMLQQIAASGSASYAISLGKEHRIRLGLTGGYYQINVNPQGAIVLDNGDVIANGGLQSASNLNTVVGIIYEFKGLEISMSSAHVVQTFSDFGYLGLDGYGLKRHFLGYLAYTARINDKINVKPSIMYKGIGNVNQFDFNADFSFNNFIQFGVGYRTKVGVIGRLGLTIRDIFFLGYAYEVPMQNIAKYGTGSHEVIVGLKLCKKQKNKEIADDSSIRNGVDTMSQNKYRIDTLIVERIDTVFIEKNQINGEISTEDAQRIFNYSSKKIEFEYDKAIILRKSYGELDAITNILLVRKDLKIRLEGHTDNMGTDEYNLELSKNRVYALKEFLVANGIDSDRIELLYFGESKPIGNNETESGRAMNRRVDIHIIE